MRFHSFQKPSIEDEKTFLKESKFGSLSVINGDKILSGIQNYFLVDENIVIHVGRTDEQAKALLKAKDCLFSIFKEYSLIPSHWIHPEYGGAANMCFKYQEYVCEIEILDTVEKKTEYFNIMMEDFLEKNTWKRIEDRPELYDKKMEALYVVILKPTSKRIKWNFLQSKKTSERLNVISELEKRAEGIDKDCAFEIKQWL